MPLYPITQTDLFPYFYHCKTLWNISRLLHYLHLCHIYARIHRHIRKGLLSHTRTQSHSTSYYCSYNGILCHAVACL